MPKPTPVDPRHDTFRIPKSSAQVPAARERVRTTVVKRGLESLADDVELVASELVANAVRYCRTTFARVEIALRVDGGMLVLEVSDPDEGRIPVPQQSGEEGEGGRGLLVVAGVAELWGFAYREFGKCVWARFRVPEGRRGAGPA